MVLLQAARQRGGGGRRPPSGHGPIREVVGRTVSMLTIPLDGFAPIFLHNEDTTGTPPQKADRMQSIMYYVMLYMYRTTRAATTVLVVTSTTVLVVAYW